MDIASGGSSGHHSAMVAERVASLDAALAAAAAEGVGTVVSSQEEGAAIDWEADVEAEPSVRLARSLSVRQLRALLQEHSAHSRVSPFTAKPLVLLSLQELRVAALPLVGSLLWDPAYKTARGWGKDALQELCDAQGISHDGTAEAGLARRVACWYLRERFELPGITTPRGCPGCRRPGRGDGGRDDGAQQAGQGQQAQQDEHTSSAGQAGNQEGAAQRRARAAPRPANDEGIPNGVEVGSRLEVRQEVEDIEMLEVEFIWTGATVEARLERLPDSDAPQRFLLRYDEDPTLPPNVIKRAIVSFISEGQLCDEEKGLMCWQFVGDDAGDAPHSDSESGQDDRLPPYLDHRIAREYAGPADEAFRRDTLVTAAYDLFRGRDDLGFWGTERRWTNVLEDLRLHYQVPPEEAAARGSALLAGTAGRPPTRREMAALAAWLGRDQEALRASGTTPDAAVEEEFVRRWDALKALKLRAQEEATAISLVALGDVERLRSLCSDADQDFTSADSAGWTPLHLAAYLSHVECLKVLIEAARQRGGAQAFLDAKDRRGRTALHRAVDATDADGLKELLQARACCAVKDRDGRTALHWALDAAATDQQASRLQLLLSEAQDLAINALDEEGMSALHLAVVAKEEECIEALLDAHADVNVRNSSGETALHFAVMDGEREIVQLLLDRGADPNLRDDSGSSPAELAADYGYEEIEELLAQSALLKRLHSGGSRGPRRLLSSLSSRNMPSVEPDLGEDEACVVCMRRRREVILAPCGHRHLCKGCTRSILTGPRTRRSCPICKETIASFVSQVLV
ncbi:hypothetical protein ABPG77_009865 [Micractinium sp. CCAP 211/92]